MEVVNKIGRRKAAIARVYLKPGGKGAITINHKDYKEYFVNRQLQYIVLQPLSALDSTDKYDVFANLRGGGDKGQAEALRLGISRALASLDPENQKVLKSHGFLTRDPRAVERKKPGRKKARKRFQFSKR